MRSQGTVEIVTPPNRLKAKVAGLGNEKPLELDESLIAQASAAIKELEQNYEQWLAADISSLSEAYDAALRKPADCQTHFDAMAEHAHNIKGQAGTFGYDLVAEIANSLNGFVHDRREATALDIEIVSAHIQALRVVHAQQLRGDGGKIGEELLKSLRQVVGKRA